MVAGRLTGMKMLSLTHSPKTQTAIKIWHIVLELRIPMSISLRKGE
jgi:hypothetical protein